jgi:hypothetical protein
MRTTPGGALTDVAALSRILTLALTDSRIRALKDGRGDPSAGAI